MKKCLMIAAVAAFVVFRLGAGYFDDKGLISGWKFAPLQIDAGLEENRKLVDESSHTLFSLGLLLLQQRSAVISWAVIANTLQDNYGIQLPSLILGCSTDNNYGISIGWNNYCKKCYGMQIGVLNHSWAGDGVREERERWQFFGINIADFLYLGLVNISNEFQIGLVNLSHKATFQLGLLNFNPDSYIPWMPLVNFSMGKNKK